MNNLFQKALDARGLPVREAAKRHGCKYITMNKHYTGKRNVSAESALLYERLLGIPRSELRPDLWPPDPPPVPCPEALEAKG